MKIFKRLLSLFVVLSCVFFNMWAAQPAVDIADLYGNKFANLVLLEQNIAKNLAIQTGLKSIGGFNVAVPEFVGLSHQQSIEYLKKQGLDLEAEWAKIVASNPTDSFFIESSQKISEKILELKKEEESQKTAAEKLFLDVPAVKKFVDSAKDFKAMVRSTGKEDTKKVSNAGGNESYANVPVDYENLQKYVNAVIASGLAKKSIEQRLVEKDETIKFLPSVPVLIQRMVGEKEGGSQNIAQIPVGCVVYTQETYANTSGVTVIQGSWGHNAGVVDNLVPVDTFLVDKNLNIRSLIIKKDHRLIPVNERGQHALKMVLNPAEIQDVPVLDREAVLAIKLIADAIQKFYKNEPTDIELVYMPHLKTVYLVQARPLRLTSNFKPSYIKSYADVPQEKIIKVMQTVLPADCAVRKITDKNQVLIAQTLNDALETFIKSDFNKEQIQAVIVTRNAETTSHAAAIFRGAEKPVFLVSDLEKIKSLVEKKLEKEIVYVDGQSETIVCAENLEIVGGWFTHPMPKKVSILDLLGPVRPERSVAESNGYERADQFPEKTLQGIVVELKSESATNAVHALNSVLFRIKQKLNTLHEDTKNESRKYCAEAAELKLAKIYNHACQIADKVKSTFNRPAFDIERLYAINELEAILLQAEDDKYIDVYSVESLQKTYEKEVDFIEQKLVKSVGSLAKNILSDRQLFLAAKQGFAYSLTPSTENLWLRFISAVSSSDVETKRQFTKLMDMLNDFNALSSWINLSFATTFSTWSNLKKYMQNIFSELNKSNQLLNKLEMIAVKLKNVDLNVWAEPAKFESTMKRFKQDYFDYFISEDLKKEFQVSSGFVKILTLSVMDKFVDTFDQSIKTLKSSTKYASVEDLVKNFKTMLQANFDLLNCCVHMLPKKVFKYHLYWPLNKYLDQIQSILNSLDNSANQLLATPDFSVANACLGSTTAFERNFPKTGEDCFTLLHQNLLVTFGAHLRMNLPQKWDKPVMFAAVEQELCKSNYAYKLINKCIEKYNSLKNSPNYKQVLAKGLMISLYLAGSLGSSYFLYNLDPSRMTSSLVLKIIKAAVSFAFAHFSLAGGMYGFFGCTKIVYDKFIGNNAISFLDSSWLIGTRIDGQKLISRYNCPLQNHSLVFELIYDKSENKTELVIRFVGQRRSRWDIIKKFADIQGKFALPVKESSIGENEVVIVYEITSKQELVQLKSALNAMIFAANNENDSRTSAEIKKLIMSYDLVEKLKEAYDSCDVVKKHTEQLFAQNGTHGSIAKKLFERSKIKNFRKKILDLVFEKKYKNASESQRLEYYEKLIEYGYDEYYAESLAIAKNAVLSSSEDIKVKGLNILQMLVDKKYTPVYPVAMKVCKDLNDYRLPFVQGIIQALIKAEYSPAYEYFDKLEIERITFLFYTFSMQYKTKIQKFLESSKTKHFKEALLKLLKNASESQRLEYYEKLLKYGYDEYYSESLILAKNAVLNSSEDVKAKGVNILKMLVVKKYTPAYQAYVDAIKANDFIAGVDNCHVYTVERLLMQHYEPACEVAYEYFKKLPKAYVSSSGSKINCGYMKDWLIRLLVENGYEPAYADALAWALKKSGTRFSTAPIELFTALINQRYEPAFEPALKLLKESMSWYQGLVALHKALLTQNYKPAFDYFYECRARSDIKTKIGMTAYMAWYRTKNAVKCIFSRNKKAAETQAVAA